MSNQPTAFNLHLTDFYNVRRHWPVSLGGVQLAHSFGNSIKVALPMLVRSSSSPRILENDVACRPDVRPSFRSQLKSPYSGLTLYVPRAESPGPGKHGDKAKAQGPFCLCLWPVGAHLVNGHRDRLRMSYGHRNQPTSLCTASRGHPLDRTVVHRPGTHSSPSGCYHDRTAMAHDADPSLSQHTLTYGLFHNNIFVGCRKARRCHCTHSSSSEYFLFWWLGGHVPCTDSSISWTVMGGYWSAVPLLSPLTE